MFKLLKESWLSLTLILVILATVCTATFAWQVDQKQMPLTATSALVNVKLNLANNEESDPGVLNLAALQDGQTAYIPFKMQNVSNIQTEVNFRVLVKNVDGEEIEDALADWEIAILDNGEPLERSEDGTSFVAQVGVAEEDADFPRAPEPGLPDEIPLPQPHRGAADKPRVPGPPDKGQGEDGVENPRS